MSGTLAPANAAGRSLGVYHTGLRISETGGPALLTWLCLSLGSVGWAVIGVVLLCAAMAAPRLTAWAQARPGGDVALVPVHG